MLLARPEFEMSRVEAWADRQRARARAVDPQPNPPSGSWTGVFAPASFCWRFLVLSSSSSMDLPPSWPASSDDLRMLQFTTEKTV